MKRDLELFCLTARQRVVRYLGQKIRQETPITYPQLSLAMQYVLNAGGKRLRPTLFYALGAAFHCPLPKLDALAGAVELIHLFSLVHDDLPGMDNDRWRHGKPCCHLMYGEGNAILVGDALLALAFRCIVDSPWSGNQQARLTAIMSRNLGVRGLVQGQAMDIANLKLTPSLLEEMYYLKTGVLFNVVFTMVGEVLNLSALRRQRLTKLARRLGIWFQIQDDLLDVTTERGKTQGIDLVNQRTTYPSLVGVAAAQLRQQELVQEMVALLKQLKLMQSYFADLLAFYLHLS